METQPRPFIYVLPMVCFQLYQQSLVVVTETTGYAKLKYLLSGPGQKKICQTLVYVNEVPEWCSVQPRQMGPRNPASRLPWNSLQTSTLIFSHALCSSSVNLRVSFICISLACSPWSGTEKDLNKCLCHC